MDKSITKLKDVPLRNNIKSENQNVAGCHSESRYTYDFKIYTGYETEQMAGTIRSVWSVH